MDIEMITEQRMYEIIAAAMVMTALITGLIVCYIMIKFHDSYNEKIKERHQKEIDRLLEQKSEMWRNMQKFEQLNKMYKKKYQECRDYLQGVSDTVFAKFGRSKWKQED